MEALIKIFNSLNCKSCNSPFMNEGPHTPYQLNCGWGAICHACGFGRLQRLTMSRHVDYCGSCSNKSPSLAYFLMELLNDDSLRLRADKKGHVLIKPIHIPECSICHEEYSMNKFETRPFPLQCAHAVCVGCFEKLGERSLIDPIQNQQPTVLGGHSASRQFYFLTDSAFCRTRGQNTRGGPPITGYNPFQRSEQKLFNVTCPVCQKTEQYKDNELKKPNPLEEFLNELPTMMEQLKILGEGNISKVTVKETSLETKKGGKNKSTDTNTKKIQELFICVGCQKEYHIDDMFCCQNCNIQICGSCAYRRHRNHDTLDLVEEAVKRLATEAQECLTNVVETYEKTFPNLHQNLNTKIEFFKKSLLTKAEKIGTLKYNDANAENDLCNKLGSKFEEIAEKYLPNLRSFDTELQNLIDEFVVDVDVVVDKLDNDLV